MSKTEIKKEPLNRFLDYITLKGDVENLECLLKGDKNGLTACLQSKNSVVAIRAELAGDFVDLGSIGIDDLKLIKKFVSNFKQDKVNFEKEENRLAITALKSKTKALAVLREPSLMKYNLPVEKFNDFVIKTSGNEFTIKKETLKDIVKHYEAIGSTELTLSGKGKELFLNLKNKENELITSFDLDSNISEFKVYISQTFIDIISLVDADMVVSFKTGSFLYMKIKDADLNVEYIICPLTSTKK